jgi:Putative auto-transporter adhesin, head GIN domain
MKTFIKLSILILVFLTSCSKDEIKGNGDIIKTNRNLTSFSNIEVSDGIELILTKSTTEKVEVETYSNIQQHVLTSIVGNKLIIKLSDANINVNILKVYVSVINCEQIIANDGCIVNATNTLDFTNLKVNVNDASNFNANIIVSVFEGNLSDGSSINLSGTSTSTNLISANGSNFADYGFATNIFNCNVKDGGNVKITVNQTLGVVTSDGSSINYKGNGTVNSVNLTSGATLNHN